MDLAKTSTEIKKKREPLNGTGNVHSVQQTKLQRTQ